MLFSLPCTRDDLSAVVTLENIRHLTFSPPAVAGKDPTCHCQASQRTSSVAEWVPRSHAHTGGDQLSVSQVGSPPEIIHFNLVLSITSTLTLNNCLDSLVPPYNAEMSNAAVLRNKWLYLSADTQTFRANNDPLTISQPAKINSNKFSGLHCSIWSTPAD